MYYHVRLDKITHFGNTDMAARVAWDFRSLDQALAMIKRDFGALAECWRIQDLTECVTELTLLAPVLKEALESCYQYVVLTFKDGISEMNNYDHYEFFFAARDEEDCPPGFKD